jgi:hypothetical protein
VYAALGQNGDAGVLEMAIIKRDFEDLEIDTTAILTEVPLAELECDYCRQGGHRQGDCLPRCAGVYI